MRIGHSGEQMMNIAEEIEIVEKMKKKGNSEVAYADGNMKKKDMR